ncbi:uncharacterized protein LOC114935487 [Nylanderia fulva]|uniref:uncharacterized protein LOC114930348 n=2 Tax=Nylanderia fulva TaxID=613905 RepID=UPI0010FAE649|nr:uncharacterized protein LOC114930348 [Nylanderia fulva]XP_029164167.1 uncharacterized protein LOC114935487 [Nylanderia fulva]
MHSNEQQNQIHNTYIENVAELKENAAELNPNDENAAELNSNYANAAELNTNNDNYNIVIMSSVLRPVDETIPDVQSVIKKEVQDAPLYTLRRKTTEPVQMHTELRAEELAWFFLFPKRRNGLHEPSGLYPITPLDYCQARIMCQDPRFQQNDYLFYCLSVMEYYRARQNVDVCLRFRQGNNIPEGLVQNLHINMRALRGSNAYWQTACSGLIAMVRNLGPPQWFLTLSCNDFNWKDILQACLIAAQRKGENVDNLEFNEKQRLVVEHPVVLSRHFMVRVHAMMRVLLNDDTLLGEKLIDFWWRIEFQNRGSLHLHMLCWNEGIPLFEGPQGIALIDKIVSCTSSTGDDELDALIARVQVHRHSNTCYKDRQHGQCRFGFPRRVSDTTTLLGPDEAIRNNGRFCILKRNSTDVFVNNYNPTLLKLWNGNMDLQPCGNVTGIAYYIAKYAAKHESHDVGQAIKDAISRVQRYGGDIGKQLFAVSMTILRHRQISACECAFRLCHLKLRDSSRKVVFLNTCFPQERYRMLRCDGYINSVYANLFDRYCLRPENLNDLSLAEFAVTYECVSRFDNYEEDGDIEVYNQENDVVSTKYIRLQDGTKMKRRTRPAVLRTRYYTQTSNREAYFYSYLVAHVPFRNEEELLEGYETAEQAFNAKRQLLRPLRRGQNIEQFQFVEQELQEVIAQIAAFDDGDTNAQSTEEQDVEKHFF